MLATAPMDREDDLARALVIVRDDVGDECTQKLLARSHRHARGIPCGLEVFRESRKIGRRRAGDRPLQCRQSSLTGLHPLQRRLPALLELRGDESIVRIAGRVASLGERGLLAGLLQLQLYDAPLLALLLHVSVFGVHRRLNRERRDREKQLAADGNIDALGSEGQTSWATQHLVGTLAAVDG